MSLGEFVAWTATSSVRACFALEVISCVNLAVPPTIVPELRSGSEVLAIASLLGLMAVNDGWTCTPGTDLWAGVEKIARLGSGLSSQLLPMGGI